MRFKYIKNLSKYLGEVAQEDVLYKEHGRWGYKSHDFSASEKQEALSRSKGIAAILVMAHNKMWNEIFCLLRVYMPETNISFKMQKEIIKTCAYNGIRIKGVEGREGEV